MKFRWKVLGIRSLVGLLVLLLSLTPRMACLAFAQDDSAAAPDTEVKIFQKLAQKGYLGEKKDFYANAKTLSEDDVLDALAAINDSLLKVDLKAIKPGSADYSAEDLKSILGLVREKADDILARNISVWKFENRLKKMIAAISPVVPEGTPAAATPSPTDMPQPTATATPIPGPSRAEWDELKGNLRDLTKKTGDLQEDYDKKIDALQKNGQDLQTANADLKTANSDLQEQFQLVKRLLDRVQDDLKKTQDHLDQVEQKATEKSISDTELQQELTIMHKDLRDNSQDVSVLKQEVVKLDKTDSDSNRSALDDFLSSKWLAGGALVVGLAALVVSLTKK